MKKNIYPELTGTPKQVAWANDIREKIIPCLESVYVYKMDLLQAFINENTSAKYWIEQQNNIEHNFKDYAIQQTGDEHIFDYHDSYPATDSRDIEEINKEIWQLYKSGADYRILRARYMMTFKFLHAIIKQGKERHII